MTIAATMEKRPSIVMRTGVPQIMGALARVSPGRGGPLRARRLRVLLQRGHRGRRRVRAVRLREVLRTAAAAASQVVRRWPTLLREYRR